jgi:hypothetical protein
MLFYNESRCEHPHPSLLRRDDKTAPEAGLQPGRLFQAAKLAIFSGFSDTPTVIFHHNM